MGSVGTPEILLVLVIALLLFGPQKLPELGKSLGRAIREFKKASAELQETIEREVEDVQRQTRDGSPGAGPRPQPSDLPAGALPPPGGPMPAPSIKAPRADSETPPPPVEPR